MSSQREPGDDADRAQEIEEAAREDGIAEVRRRVQHGDWNVLSAKWCEAPACGERIPEARRRAIPGVRLCIECAHRTENRTRGW